MAGRGPAPDPNALRRARDEGEWVSLPAAGRSGPTPVFPLPEPSDRELEHWAEMWTLPQAVMWERLRLGVEVAMYVRQLSASERPDANVTRLQYVRLIGESLGVSLPGMLRHKWRIDTDGDTAVVARKRRVSARDRLTVVPDGG